jgi:hypothetical protein
MELVVIKISVPLYETAFFPPFPPAPARLSYVSLPLVPPCPCLMSLSLWFHPVSLSEPLSRALAFSLSPSLSPSLSRARCRPLALSLSRSLAKHSPLLSLARSLVEVAQRLQDAVLRHQLRASKNIDVGRIDEPIAFFLKTEDERHLASMEVSGSSMLSLST